MIRFTFFLCCLLSAAVTNDICKTKDLKYPISCVDTTLCKPLQDLLAYGLNQNLDATVRNFIKSYSCGLNGHNPKVWCQQQSMELEPPNVDNHKNVNFLPRNCGIGQSIENNPGNKTGIFEYPWMALLSYATNQGPLFKCSGTIITSKFILTAAHCIPDDRSTLISVRVGDHNVFKPIDCEKDRNNQTTCAPTFQDLEIFDVISHADYDPKTNINDIALLKVSKIDFLAANTEPICLPLQTTRNLDLTNVNVITTGWGITQTELSSPELLKTTLSVLDNKSCKQKYINQRKISERQLCAINIESNVCGGDGGGPLQHLARQFEDFRMILHGIISHYTPGLCSSSDAPIVITRVDYYMDWILESISE